MRFKPSIHSPALGIKNLLGRFEKLFGKGYDPLDLYVVNYHSTPLKFIPAFKEHLKYYLKNFRVISPQDLENFYNGITKEHSKPSLLLTFDDGLKNNLFAATAMEEFGIKAFFFVVPEFIQTPEAEQKSYYLKYIRPVANPLIDSNIEDFIAMKWDDIRLLEKKGNLTGSHTFSHTLMSGESDLKNSEKEITLSKNVIEKELQKKIEAFCSINNTLLSVGETEKKLIKQHYRFHFTTLPGSNARINDPLFISRRNVEVYWPTGAFYYSLGNWDTERWNSKVEQYRKI
jgi:peptidoglycan/xylan/chitin deacetylase (PgdA/CDA1 family)